MSQLPVLIVDDEPDLCELLTMTLSRINLNSDSACDIAEAKALLKKNRYSLCLTDMRLPDGNGLDLVTHITSNFSDTPVAVITAHGSMDTAIEALKRGAFDFLSKPVELNQLKAVVNAATQLPESVEESDLNVFETRLTGSSAATSALRKTLLKVARSQAPVFIQGESGSGKEVCARLIHEHSARKYGPFIAVNCGAIPSELVESEFFGHKKGSFTGAVSDQPGLFLSANGGTLLLDEVADLPLVMQVKLLRAIQEKSVRAVGSNTETPVDVRIISATHKNLAQLVQENLFRNDLYYRINVIEVRVPPLRERTEDIEAIAGQILSGIAKEVEQSSFSLSASAIEKLKAHDFPGNIRELENTLERTVALCDSSLIDAEHLVFQSRSTINSSQNNSAPHDQSNQQQPTDKAKGFDPDSESLDDYLQAIEKKEITAALTHCKWNRTETARYLGISFRSLRYRLKKLKLDD